MKKKMLWEKFCIWYIGFLGLEILPDGRIVDNMEKYKCKCQCKNCGDQR